MSVSPCSVFVGCARVSRLMSRALPREQSSFPPRCFGFLFLFHFPGYILCRVRSMGVMRSFSRNTSWLDFSNANTCGNTSLQNSTVQRRVQVFVLDQTAWYNCAPVVFLIRWDLLLGALGRRCVDGNGAVQIVVLDFAQLSLQDTSYGGPARLWWWRQGVSSVMLRTRPVVAAFRWVLLLVVTRSRMNLESALTCAQVAIRNFSSAWTLSAVAKAFASARSGASCACRIGIPNIAPASGSVTTGHQCIGPHHA